MRVRGSGRGREQGQVVRYAGGGTGVPHLQENTPPWDPTLGLCLGSKGVPRGMVFSYGRGTPVRGGVSVHSASPPQGILCTPGGVYVFLMLAVAVWFVPYLLDSRPRTLHPTPRTSTHPHPSLQISSRRVFLRNTTSGISDPICSENYHTFALGRDRKFQVCSNFPCEIVFLRNTRSDEIQMLVNVK